MSKSLNNTAGLDLPPVGSLLIVPRQFLERVALQESLNVIRVVSYLLIKNSEGLAAVSYNEIERELGQCRTALDEAVNTGYILADELNNLGQTQYRLRSSSNQPPLAATPPEPERSTSTAAAAKTFIDISNLIIEISQEFGETGNSDLAANKSQIHTIWRQSKLTEQEMLDFMGSTRLITRNQFEMGSLKNPMSYFFRTLRNEINRAYPNLVDSGGRQRSRGGSTYAANPKARTVAPQQQQCQCVREGKPVPDGGCPYQTQQPKLMGSEQEGEVNW